VWAQKQVTVVVDGRDMRIESQAADVAGLLSQAGVRIGQGDLVYPATGTRLTAGMSVVVRHAVPVTVVVGNAENHLNVVGKTVADALVAAGVDPAANVGVAPSLDSPLQPGMTISATDAFSRVNSVTEPIPFKIEQHEDDSLPRGTKRVVKSGAPGTTLQVYSTIVVGGVEGTATLSASKVLAPPVNRVIAIGTAEPADAHQLEVAGFGAKLERAVALKSGRRLRVVATAYSAEEPGATSATATGRRAQKGVIAVDPHVIPLGTHVYVPGYGYAVAGDTGGMINGEHIDLCYDSVGEVNAWGKRHVVITILDD
jgi:3D (Asp-Asp-Asp) domain-containing protein